MADLTDLVAHPPELVVVDDHPANLELLMKVLTAKGYMVRAFPDAELALASIRMSVPDLILLDVGLPGLDGFQACRQLRGEEGTKDVPVIFLSARVTPDDIVQGFDAGGSDYVTKPIRERELLARIHVHVQVKQLQDKLRRLSTIDGLTGLYNRRMLDETIQNEWRRNQRQKAWLGVILADVDYFKAYNDSYGHLKGDLCLRAIAHAIGAAARRSGDFAARYGGEEFAVLLPNTDLSGAALVAERIRSTVLSLQIEHASSPAASVVTVSLGMHSLVPSRNEEPTHLIELADERLYAAKRSGRNCIVCDDATAPPQLVDHTQS